MPDLQSCVDQLVRVIAEDRVALLSRIADLEASLQTILTSTTDNLAASTAREALEEAAR